MTSYWLIALIALVFAYRILKRRNFVIKPKAPKQRVDFISRAAGNEDPIDTPAEELISADEEAETDDYSYDVVGESYQRDHLTALIRAHKAFDKGEIYTTAILEPEPTNEFDRTAVKVIIDNTQVGYIPKYDSPTVTELIAKSGKKTMEVKARIGWDTDNPSPAVGVRLALELD